MGKCQLDIYTIDKAATIPMLGNLVHAQLANSQSCTHHDPQLVDKDDDSTDRTLVLARNAPDLAYPDVLHAMLEQLETNYPVGGLKAF